MPKPGIFTAPALAPLVRWRPPMSKPAKQPENDPNGQKLASPMRPMLWLLLPLIAVLVWGLLNR